MKKTVIYKIKWVGKWVEFWIKPKRRTTFRRRSFDMCSKGYKLDRAIDECGIREHVEEHGLIGCVITWEHDGHNYEIGSIDIPRSKRGKYKIKV